MHVYLLRHGAAAPGTPGRTDAERPLTEPGVRDLRAACRIYAALMEPIEILVSSPLLRARQTAEILAAALPATPRRREAGELEPGADPDRALRLAQASALEGASVAFVGHEPHLGGLLGALLLGGRGSAIPLRKGMMVAVEVAEPTSMAGRLRWALDQDSALRVAAGAAAKRD